jgi:hypothetical protein
MTKMPAQPASPPPVTPATSDGPEVWPLVFKATGDGPPPAVRVRRLLKFALRGCGLKCIGYDAVLRRNPPTVGKAGEE